MKGEAFFSDCGGYRWRLKRVFNDSPKELIFVGLNPSLANVSYNDQTLKRLIGFCEIWGYGTLTVINLFAKISTSPRSLNFCKDPIGKKNNAELKRNILYWENIDLCDLWIGWGVKGQLLNRDQYVLDLIKKQCFKKPYVIGITKNGNPQHPLYISKRKVLFRFY